MRIAEGSPLVLGSASPRRRELLTTLGVPFVVRPAGVDETALSREAPDAYLYRVTNAKLVAVRAEDLGHAAGVLVADTVVVAPDGALLGKPEREGEALAMLDRLAGKTHVVKSRFVLAETGSDAPPAWGQTVTTRVTFRPFARGEAAAYAATGEGADKAGAYAAQGSAAAFIERIEGSYTNVVGLPLSEVAVALRDLGWI